MGTPMPAHRTISSRNTLAITLALLILGVFLGTNHVYSGNVSSHLQSGGAHFINGNGQKKSNWTFWQHEDQMRQTTMHVFALKSDNELDFGEPYGQSRAILALRQHCCGKNPLNDLEMSVVLLIEGQFICTRYGDDTINMRFDDGPIQKFRCRMPSDGSTNVVSIDDRALGFKIYSDLERASKLIVEAPIFQRGRQQFVFTVSGFKDFLAKVPPFPHRNSKPTPPPGRGR